MKSHRVTKRTSFWFSFNFYKTLDKLIPLIVFLSFIILFLGPQIVKREVFVTPDFGRSDLLHQNLPLKEFLADSLRGGEMPLWNPYVGNGIPQLAESQIGALQPFNILLFTMLPLDIAFNLSYVVIFATFFFSTYFYLRIIKCSRPAAVICALAFTFSTGIIARITHFNLIQGLSFFPLLLFIVEYSVLKKRPLFLLFISLVLAIQIFSGHLQIVLYSTIFIFLYLVGRLMTSSSELAPRYPVFSDFLRKGRSGASSLRSLRLVRPCSPQVRSGQVRSGYWLNPRISSATFPKAKIFIFIVAFITFVTLGGALSAAQLLPSQEYLNLYSKVKSGQNFLDELRNFPFVAKNFLAFFYPYANGDPRIGTYPEFGENWGIFWESTGYFGIVPLLFSILALFSFKKNRFVPLYLFLSVTMAALTLGKNSPFFILFEFQPLSIFRVPARFVIFLTFSLVVLSAIGLTAFIEKFKRSKKALYFIILIVFLAVFADLLYFAKNYHIVGKEKEWMSCPRSGEVIKRDSDIFRIYSVGNAPKWAGVFNKVGWLGKDKEYFALRNGLDVYFSQVCGFSSPEDYHVSLSIPRQRILIDAVRNNISLSNKSVNISTNSAKLLSLSNVRYIVSPFAIKGEGMEPFSYYVYKNNLYLPRVVLVSKISKISTLEDFFRKVGEEGFDFRTTVLVEDDINLESKEASSSKAIITSYKNQEVTVLASSEKSGVLVLFDNYYPGWKVFVNGKEGKIIKADFAFRGVVIPAGTNMIVFRYQPDQWRNGLVISLVTLAAIIILMIKVGFLQTIKRKLFKS